MMDKALLYEMLETALDSSLLQFSLMAGSFIIDILWPAEFYSIL